MKILLGVLVTMSTGAAIYLHVKRNQAQNQASRRGAVLNQLGVDLGLVDAGRYDEAMPPAVKLLASEEAQRLREVAQALKGV
jgi:hypothetical protein